MCEKCNVLFNVGTHRSSTAKFCSVACLKLGLKGIRRSPRTEFKAGSSGFNGKHSQETKEKLRQIKKEKMPHGYLRDGYRIVSYFGKQYREHRLNWILAHGEIPVGYDVHHKNGNKLDNSLKNLELIDHAEHIKQHWIRKKKNQQRNNIYKRQTNHKIEKSLNYFKEAK